MVVELILLCLSVKDGKLQDYIHLYWSVFTLMHAVAGACAKTRISSVSARTSPKSNHLFLVPVLTLYTTTEKIQTVHRKMESIGEPQKQEDQIRVCQKKI